MGGTGRAGRAPARRQAERIASTSVLSGSPSETTEFTPASQASFRLAGSPLEMSTTRSGSASGAGKRANPIASTTTTQASVGLGKSTHSTGVAVLRDSSDSRACAFPESASASWMLPVIIGNSARHTAALHFVMQSIGHIDGAQELAVFQALGGKAARRYGANVGQFPHP